MGVAVALCLGLGAWAATAADKDGDTRPATPLTALEIRAPRAPQVVTGTDGRRHLEYDLIITNVFTADASLGGVEVYDGRGRLLLELSGAELAGVTTEFLGTDPTTTVPKSGAVLTVIDVVLPPGAPVPARVTHRVGYSLPEDAPFVKLLGSRTVAGPVLAPERRAPIVVAPPLRGPGWIAVNACCQPSSHRSFVLSANGALVTPEVFAIDFSLQRDGLLFTGDGSQNAQWLGHGAPVVAASDGTVVAAVDGIPEVPPNTTAADNPTLTDTDSFGGNHVLVRMRPGVFALYGHLIPGSLRVAVGDRVVASQQLGLLGNTGNTSAPHLHFGLIDGLGVLSSDSLPFVIDSFTFGGVATFTEDGVSISGSPRPVVRAHPLSNTIADFAP